MKVEDDRTLESWRHAHRDYFQTKAAVALASIFDENLYRLAASDSGFCSKMNYKLLIQYDGSDFHGWQVQENARTIQGELRTRVIGHSKAAPVQGRRLGPHGCRCSRRGASSLTSN
jgi:hypothetical protein